MKAILRHKGELMVLNLRELTPPGWFTATVEASVPDEVAVEESQKMLALPAPAIHGARTGRFSGTSHIVEVPKANIDQFVREPLAKKQDVLSNLKSGIYRYMPKRVTDAHREGVDDLIKYLKKSPLSGTTPFSKLWATAFPDLSDMGSFRLAVAAIGHGKHWTISEGRSTHGNRRIFLIGPK
jgi:hypothetical protein